MPARPTRPRNSHAARARQHYTHVKEAELTGVLANSAVDCLAHVPWLKARCQNPLSEQQIAEARRLLLFGRISLNREQVRSLLLEMAKQMLCEGRHWDDAADVMQQWYRDVTWFHQLEDDFAELEGYGDDDEGRDGCHDGNCCRSDRGRETAEAQILTRVEVALAFAVNLLLVLSLLVFLGVLPILFPFIRCAERARFKEAKARSERERVAAVAEAARAREQQAEERSKGERAREEAAASARRERREEALRESERLARELRETDQLVREARERRVRDLHEERQGEARERRDRRERERDAEEERERKAWEEYERREAKEEAERRARREAGQKAREERERKTKEKRERKEREERERREKEEREQKAWGERRRREREERKRKASKQRQQPDISWESAWQRYESENGRIRNASPQLSDLAIQTLKFWPTKTGVLSSCTEAAVKEFFDNRPRCVDNSAMRRQLLRWHSDKLETVFGHSEHKEMLKDTLKMVTQVLNGIRENASG